MARPTFGKNIDPNVGKDTQFGASEGNDPTKGGRKPSIRNQLKEILEAEGKLRIEPQNVVSINDDGSITINVPTEMQIAMKLKQWAMSKRGTDSIKAIQMIMEQIDGKPEQKIDMTNMVGSIIELREIKNDN